MRTLNVIIAAGLGSAGACLGFGLFLTSSEPMAAALISYGTVVGLFSMYAAFLVFFAASIVLTVRLIRRSEVLFIGLFSFSALNALAALGGALFVLYGRV